MSDNEDLLGDDLGDHSLNDYNLGNEEEEQLLADDYENANTQNVPLSGPYIDNGVVPTQYSGHQTDYGNQQISYQPVLEAECVVPNITVEIPNAPALDHSSTYAPYTEPPQVPVYEAEHAVVPPAIPAAPLESPQIVPSEIMAPSSADVSGAPGAEGGAEGGPRAARARFVSERPAGAHKAPRHRDIPDSLDKVVVPYSAGGGGAGPRGRSWRSPQWAARFHHPHTHPHSHPHQHHPYRRNYVHWNNSFQRQPYQQPRVRFNPPPVRPDMRPDIQPDMRLDMRPDIQPEMRPDMRPEMRPDIRPDMRPELHPDMRPEMRPDIRPDMRPELHPDMRPEMRPDMRPDMRLDNRPDMRPDMRLDNRPDMRPDIRLDNRPDMRPEMRPDIRQDMRDIRPDMRPEMRPDMRPEMRPDMRPEMRPDMRPEMRPDLRPEMRPDIRPDMRPDLRPEMRPDIRPDMRPDVRPDMRPEMRPEMRPDIRPDIRHEMRPDIRPDLPMPPSQMGPDISPERPMLPHEMPGAPYRPPFNANFSRFPPPQYRPRMEEARPPFGPNFRPMAPAPYQRAPFGAPRFAAPVREVAPSSVSHMPQVTLRQPGVPGAGVGAGVGELPPGPPGGGGREPEVRMLPLPLPLQLPPSLPPGKKVLINPHFKGNFQPPPVEGLPTYIPTRIRKTPPLSPTLESKFGPIKDIDDAAERFIAEQRSALARAGARKFARRSPLRYIENTTIEIENELAGGGPRGLRGPSGAPGVPARRRSDDELSRRQEEFINANRAGLRRRMRSPSPAAPPSPPGAPPAAPGAGAGAPGARSPERRPRARAPSDDDGEYRRRVREQESLRERVLRAKEVRRRRNAAALHTHTQDRERERQQRDKQPEPVKAESKPAADGAREARRAPPPPAAAPRAASPAPAPPAASPGRSSEPDTTRKSLETDTRAVGSERERSPLREPPVETAEVNSTCENLTPPREKMPQPRSSPPRGLTPPLPAPAPAPPAAVGAGGDSDDDVDLILDDIDDILSDDDDTGRFKEKPKKVETVKAKPPADLRARLPPRPAAPAATPAATPAPARRAHRQKIVFHDERERERDREKEKEREDRRKRDKSPARRPLVSSSTRAEDADGGSQPKKPKQSKQKADTSSAKQRQRITFDKEQSDKQKEAETAKDKTKQQSFSNRRVVLQRKVTQQPAKDLRPDPSKPHAGIFSRAVRTAIGVADRAAIGAADRARRTPEPEPEPRVEYGTDSDEERLLGEPEGNVASVANLPHGMTDTRLKTLAGGEVQSLILDKEERTAKITFKTTVAAEGFKRKFHHKMVAASRLTVTLQ